MGLKKLCLVAYVGDAKEARDWISLLEKVRIKSM